MITEFCVPLKRIKEQRLIVSACLTGIRCRYDGGHSLVRHLKRLMEKGLALPVCPELLGGLDIPRVRAEIVGGDGNDVVNSHAKVLAEDGADLTEAYIIGAKKTLEMVRIFGAYGVIFKDRSPSCGVNQIYDGSFKGALKSGEGVTTALLRANGLSVVKAW